MVAALGGVLPLLLALAGDSSEVAPSPSAQALIERHAKEKASAWADGDGLTFFYRGEAERVEVFFAGDFKDLRRLPASEVWTRTITLPGLERAVFSYRVTPFRKDAPPNEALAKLLEWRGPKAPPAPVMCVRLQGTLETRTLARKALAAGRAITVYLPPGHGRSRPSRVVYAADGQAIEGFARVLEPLVLAGRVPSVVLVGVHHGAYQGGLPNPKTYDPQKDLRAQEYFPGLNAQRFADHEVFFCREVPAWAEQHYGVSARRQDRAVFGYSNGGRFAVEIGLRHPEVFGHVFGFSVAGNGRFDFGKPTRNLPQYDLAAGTWEESFHHGTQSLARQLRQRGVPVTFTSRVGGHDLALWREEFVAAVVRAYGRP